MRRADSVGGDQEAEDDTKPECLSDDHIWSLARE